LASYKGEIGKLLPK